MGLNTEYVWCVLLSANCTYIPIAIYFADSERKMFWQVYHKTKFKPQWGWKQLHL